MCKPVYSVSDTKCAATENGYHRDQRVGVVISLGGGGYASLSSQLTFAFVFKNAKKVVCFLFKDKFRMGTD